MGVLADWQIREEKIVTPCEEGIKREGKISYGLTSYGYDCRIGHKFKVFSPIMSKEIDPKNIDQNAMVDIDLSPMHHELELVKGRVPGEMRAKGYYKCKWCAAEFYEENPPVLQCRNRVPDHIMIPPHSFVLGESVEHFKIPRDVLCVVVGKSTYARCGLIVNVTPGEPEWEGHWTIELSNTTPLPLRVYCGEGIMQCIFIRADGDTKNIRQVLRNWLEDQSFPEGNKLMRDLTVIDTYGDKNGTCETSYADKKGKYQSQTGLTLPKVEGAK